MLVNDLDKLSKLITFKLLANNHLTNKLGQLKDILTLSHICLIKYFVKLSTLKAIL